jgi:pyridoxine 5-phosphate synthase
VATLSVNVDHVATVRQARQGAEPDPITAAAFAEIAGCDGIIVHLREDRRHVQDRDVELLRKTVKTKLNLEMAATEEMVGIALRIRPDLCSLVPEKREELTTEGGLDVVGNYDLVEGAIGRLQEGNIPVSLFIDPDNEQIRAAKKAGADIIEIHTGIYCNAEGKRAIAQELNKIEDSVACASRLELGIHAGHGLDYHNIQPLARISLIDEFSIGHAIIARAVLVGVERAVGEMLQLIRNP